MLKFLRSHTKLIIWIVVLSFGLWGAFSVATTFQDEGRYAGEVFGKKVTFQEFNNFYRGSRIFSFGGEPADDPDLLKLRTWQNLIYSRAAKREGVDVSDDEVRRELRGLLTSLNIPAGDPDVYKNWLKNRLRMEPKTFESQLRETIRIRKFLGRLAALESPEPTEEDVKKFYVQDARRMSGEAAFFDSGETALAARAGAQAEETWQALESPAASKEKLENASLSEAVEKLQIAPEYASSLFRLKPGEISQPIPSENAFMLFRLSQTSEPDVSALTPEALKEAAEKLKERARQLQLAQRHYQLMQESGLRDFTESEH